MTALDDKARKAEMGVDDYESDASVHDVDDVALHGEDERNVDRELEQHLQDGTHRNSDGVEIEVGSQQGVANGASF